VVHHLEAHAPPGAGVAWVGGDPTRGGLGVEEGIHVQWHLENRGRADVRIALLDASEQPVARIEVTKPAGEPAFRVTGAGGPPAGPWETDCAFSAVYQFGRKRYDCHIGRRPGGAYARTEPAPGPAGH
jgi:hypothetical protein